MIIEEAAIEKAVYFRDSESKSENLFLRISVNPGGCAGLRYELYFDSVKNEKFFSNFPFWQSKV